MSDSNTTRFVGLDAILVSWTNLIVGRHWRPEASWIDRLGRVLGAFWILITLGFTVLMTFS